MSQNQSRNRQNFQFTSQIPAGKDNEFWRKELERYAEFQQQQLDNLYEQVKKGLLDGSLQVKGP